MKEAVSFYLSAPQALTLRDSMRLSGYPADSVIPVSLDSLCNLAGVQINRHRSLPDTTTRHIAMVRLRDKYWAEDSTIQAGPYVISYLLNSKLTTILEVTGR